MSPSPLWPLELEWNKVDLLDSWLLHDALLMYGVIESSGYCVCLATRLYYIIRNKFSTSIQSSAISIY